MKRGERRVRHEAATAAVAEPPPPGETGRELSGSETVEALSDALLDITGEPRVRFANVKDIQVKKIGRWVIVTVRHNGKDTNELKFRISTAWAHVLKNRLLRALE